MSEATVWENLHMILLLADKDLSFEKRSELLSKWMADMGYTYGVGEDNK